MNLRHVHRTYEPFKFLGRLFFIPLPVQPHTAPVSYAATWEPEGEHRWGPTLIARVPFTRRAIGVGVWLDSGVGELAEERALRQAIEQEEADFDMFKAVNGPIDREKWQKAREAVAAQGLDPSEEMEMMQTLGILGS